MLIGGRRGKETFLKRRSKKEAKRKPSFSPSWLWRLALQFNRLKHAIRVQLSTYQTTTNQPPPPYSSYTNKRTSSASLSPSEYNKERNSRAAVNRYYINCLANIQISYTKMSNPLTSSFIIIITVVAAAWRPSAVTTVTAATNCPALPFDWIFHKTLFFLESMRKCTRQSVSALSEFKWLFQQPTDHWTSPKE